MCVHLYILFFSHLEFAEDYFEGGNRIVAPVKTNKSGALNMTYERHEKNVNE